MGLIEIKLTEEVTIYHHKLIEILHTHGKRDAKRHEHYDAAYIQMAFVSIQTSRFFSDKTKFRLKHNIV